MKRQRIAIVTVMAVVVLATAFGFGQSTQAQTTNQLAGTYSLITSKTTVLATGEVTHPLRQITRVHNVWPGRSDDDSSGSGETPPA